MSKINWQYVESVSPGEPSTLTGPAIGKNQRNPEDAKRQSDSSQSVLEKLPCSSRFQEIGGEEACNDKECWHSECVQELVCENN